MLIKDPPEVDTGPDDDGQRRWDLDGDRNRWRVVLDIECAGRLLLRKTRRGVNLLLRDTGTSVEVTDCFDRTVNAMRAWRAVLAGRELLRDRDYPLMRTDDDPCVRFVCTLIPGEYEIERRGDVHFLYWHDNVGTDVVDRPAHEPEVAETLAAARSRRPSPRETPGLTSRQKFRKAPQPPRRVTTRRPLD